MPYIDLHTHSTHSDGTLTPSEIVQLAKDVGLQAVSITDHDTLSGNQEALDKGNELGLQVLTGIEISVKYEVYSTHILGYNVDINNPKLLNMLERMQGSRNNRNPIIIEKLQKLGFTIDYAEVLQIAKGEVVGRPHIATVLTNKGFTKSNDEAFSKYLYDGGPAYAEKEILGPEEAFQTITQAGGIPCLAHPWFLKRNIQLPELEVIITQLITLGLKGIEAYYGDMPHKLYTEPLLALTKNHNLIITGGSDYHGANRPGIKLGCAKVPGKYLNNFHLC